MTPLNVRFIREQFMVATEKDRQWMSTWLNDREFVDYKNFDFEHPPTPWMELDELKRRYMKWEDFYWTKIKKQAFVIGVCVLIMMLF